MDLTSFGFLALMVLLGGVVAYFADNLGRTLGKKRLTLWGMRPRHTATTMTVGAGMLIPFLTVVFVAALSSDVRVWIAEGRRAIMERDEAVRDRDRVRAERNDAVGELNKTLVDRDRLRNESLRLERDLARNQQELEQGRRDLAGVRSQLQAASDQLSAAKSQIADLRAELTSKTADIASAETKLAAVTRQYESAQADYQGALTSFRQQKARLDEQYQENLRLLDDNDRLDRANANVSAELQLKQSQLRTAEEQLDTVRTQLDTQSRELQEIGTRLAITKGIADMNLDFSRRKSMIFALGDELARVPVAAGVDETRSKGHVAALLAEAGRVAVERGAKTPERGLPSAGLFPRQDEKNQPVSPEEQEAAIAKAIVGSKDDIVLVAYAVFNAFQGERVPIVIEAFRNPLVYRRGQAIAETRINGAADDEDVLHMITEFLQNQVRKQALRDKMIPYGKQNGQLGEVESDDILQLVRAIRDEGRTVRLIAYVAQDTRAADPLKLEFRIR